MPIAAWPLAASTPITSQEKLFTRSCWPSGSAPPNSSRCTVAPMTHTAAPARSSGSSKRRPAASVQLLVSKYALVVPITLVDQLRAPCTTVAAARTSGATARSPEICASMADASAAVNDGAPMSGPAPGAAPAAP